MSRKSTAACMVLNLGHDCVGASDGRPVFFFVLPSSGPSCLSCSRSSPPVLLLSSSALLSDLLSNALRLSFVSISHALFRIYIVGAPDVTIQGLTLESGYAQVVSDPSITANYFEGEGGAAVIYSGNVRFVDVKFANNRAQYHGGAVSVWGANVGFEGECSFDSNQALVCEFRWMPISRSVMQRPHLINIKPSPKLMRSCLRRSWGRNLYQWEAIQQWH